MVRCTDIFLPGDFLTIVFGRIHVMSSSIYQWCFRNNSNQYLKRIFVPKKLVYATNMTSTKINKRQYWTDICICLIFLSFCCCSTSSPHLLLTQSSTLKWSAKGNDMKPNIEAASCLGSKGRKLVGYVYTWFAKIIIKKYSVMIKSLHFVPIHVFYASEYVSNNKAVSVFKKLW
jgi:hypothetical protein